MVKTEHQLAGLVRLQVLIDQVVVGVVRDVPQVVLLDVGARASAVRRAVAVDRRPVVVVERPVIGHPVIGAPGAARHLELLDVVEEPPRAVGLPLGVALDVVREAEPRRDLLAPAERDSGVFRAVGRDVRVVEAHAVVQRQLLVHRPLILQEEPEVVRADVAFGVLLHHAVVAVGAAHGPLVEGRARAVPDERDVRFLLARVDVVADPFVLEPALERVLASPFDEPREVAADVRPHVVVFHAERVQGVVGIVVRVLQLGRNVQVADVRAGEGPPDAVVVVAARVLAVRAQYPPVMFA